MMQNDSSVEFVVDGDGSGGRYVFRDRNDLDELRLLTSQHAQNYIVLGETFGGGPHVCLVGQGGYEDEDWFQRPPYAEGGGASFGAHPTLSVTEFYVTPFDHLVWDRPAESVASTLSPGTLIGFILSIADLDEEGVRAETSRTACMGPSIRLYLAGHVI